MNEALINIDLRDIHLPDDVSWWPLAMGWWLLIAGLLLFSVLIYYWHKKNKQAKSLRALAKQELNQIQQETLSNHELFKALHLLLRKACILLPGSEDFHRDTKGRWIDWLTEELNINACPLHLRKQILTIPFQTNQKPETDELLSFTQKIIDELPEIPISHSYLKSKTIAH